MTDKSKKITYWALIVLCLLVLLLAGTAFWLYSGTVTATKTKVFQKIPFPVALVEGKPVSMKSYLERYNLANKLSQNSGIKTSEAELKKQVYSEFINEEKNAIISNKYNISVTQKEIEEDYKLREKSSDLEGKANFNQLLNSYGLTPNAYKNLAIKPDLVFAKLQVWYNSNKEINSQSYLKAQEILNKLQNGEDMGALARQYSEDETGKSLQGDVGFIDVANVLPELKEGLVSMNVGETKLLPSRSGLHILKIESKDANKIKLREIFINTSGFSQWLETEYSKIEVKKLLAS